MNIKKVFGPMLLALPVRLVVSLYTTFVVQNFWNWFVATTFHAPAIPFWGMYGLLLLWGLLSEKAEDDKIEILLKGLWEATEVMLEACIPDDKREAIRAALKDQEEGLPLKLWMKGFSKVFGTLAANTLTLVVGWGIHVFLT